MLNLDKFAGEEPAQRRAVGPGEVVDWDSWSPKKAAQHAVAEGLELTEERWMVIFKLREFFRAHGRSASARELTLELQHEFPDVAGRRHLYELFPGGPLVQGCRIAGLPPPPFSTDLSFGSFR